MSRARPANLAMQAGVAPEYRADWNVHLHGAAMLHRAQKWCLIGLATVLSATVATAAELRFSDGDVAGKWSALDLPWNERGDALRVGDPAPDVDLVTLDDADHVRLSSLLEPGKPAVLVFGSFT